MKPAVLFACLVTGLIGGCSWFPSAGPSTNEVLEQGRAGGDILFDVVEVDDRVVSTLLAQPKESLAFRFNKDAQPPEVRIAVGDTIAVLIWESAAGGLFSEAPPVIQPGARGGVEPLAPEAGPPTGERRGEFGAPSPPVRQPPRETNRREGQPPPGTPPSQLPLTETAATSGRRAAVIPEQEVGSDGAISVPYAGRITAAGRVPDEVQHTIEARLAEKALEPQALVIVRKSAANAVTVTGLLIARRRQTPRGDCRGRWCKIPGSRHLRKVVAQRGQRNDPVAAAGF